MLAYSDVRAARDTTRALVKSFTSIIAVTCPQVVGGRARAGVMSRLMMRVVVRIGFSITWVGLQRGQSIRISR